MAQSAAIEGLVIDKAENQPIDFATVALFRSGDSTMVGGTITNAEGKFKIDKVNVGNFYLVVQFMGYEPSKIENINLTKNQKMDLGTVQLAASQKLLQEIQVTGQKDLEP